MKMAVFAWLVFCSLPLQSFAQQGSPNTANIVAPKGDSQGGKSGQAGITSGSPANSVVHENSSPEPDAGHPQTSQDNERKETAARTELESELTEVAKSVNAQLHAKTPSKSSTDTLLDFLSKLAGLIVTLLGAFVTFKGLKKVPVVKDNQGIVVVGLGVVVLAVLFYFLSGLVTSVLYVLVAILVLLIALLLAGAHVLKFIDDEYPDVKDSIIAFFDGSSQQKSGRKLSRDIIRQLEQWLATVVFLQQINAETRLVLVGSFVGGYDVSVFEIHPDQNTFAHWKNLEDRMIVPITAALTVVKSEDKSSAEVVNIQPGLVVVRKSDGIEYVAFDHDGFKRVGIALVQRQIEKQKEILEKQIGLHNDLKVYNSQSLD